VVEEFSFAAEAKRPRDGPVPNSFSFLLELLDSSGAGFVSQTIELGERVIVVLLTGGKRLATLGLLVTAVKGRNEVLQQTLRLRRGFAAD
jgi:hypothetical protein